MTARRLALCTAVAAGLAFAQSAPPLEVRGTVVEGTLGIGGVTVTLYEFGHTPAEATTRTVFATTFTDSTGKFVFHPERTGQYYVEVMKEGYFAESYNGSTADPSDSIGDPVRIDTEHPLQERKFSLWRLGEVRGRVIDEDGNPISKLTVLVQTTSSPLTRRLARALTDQDGYFSAAKLKPADYLVSVAHKGPEVLPQFSKDDLKIVDQDWESSAWPSTPSPVSPGASLNVGTITARKANYYRAHLLVVPGDCAPGEKLAFSTTADAPGFGIPVPCGKEFLVRNLPAGSYSFSLTHREPPGSKAVAPGEITDRNIEITMTMSAGVDINGRVVAAEGAALPAPGVRWQLAVGGQRVMPDAAGNFLVHGSPRDPQRLSINASGGRFYIKEVRYNGQIAADGIFTPIPDAPGQLDIIIDDRAATLNGSVAEYDKVSAQITVVAMKWPVSWDDTFLSAPRSPSAEVTADDQGRFQIGGLAPGEYRILAAPVGSLSRLPPDILNRAEKVTLERGGTQSISLKIVEP